MSADGFQIMRPQSANLEAARIVRKPLRDPRRHFALATVPHRALPDDAYAPPSFAQPSGVRRISLDVALELVRPESRVGLRRRGKTAIAVTMPETAMHKDRCMMLGEDDIRPPGQPGRMQTIPKTGLVQRLAKANLRTCVFPADARHHAGSGFCINHIGQRLHLLHEYAT